MLPRTPGRGYRIAGAECPWLVGLRLRTRTGGWRTSLQHRVGMIVRLPRLPVADRYGQGTSRRRHLFGKVFTSPSYPLHGDRSPAGVAPKLSPTGFLNSISGRSQPSVRHCRAAGSDCALQGVAQCGLALLVLRSRSPVGASADGPGSSPYREGVGVPDGMDRRTLPEVCVHCMHATPTALRRDGPGLRFGTAASGLRTR